MPIGYTLTCCSKFRGHFCCTTTDIVLDAIGFIPILKPATAAIKILKRSGRMRTRTRTQQTSCSFAAGTPVATPSGPRNIEDVQAGDWVLAKDEETGRVEPKRVSHAYSSVHEDAVLLSIRQFDGGQETVLTTSEHPFRIPGEGWVPAGMLAVGDNFLVLSGEAASLEAIGFPTEPLTAYNFEIEEFHTYAVGEDAIWVHNTCDPWKRRHRDKGGPELPELDPSGTVHGDLPTFLPKEWTRDQLEQLRDDLVKSIPKRRLVNIKKGPDQRHGNRIREEERLLRQIEKTLGGS